MLLIDEMNEALRFGRKLGLVCVTNGGASFLGQVTTEADAARVARKVGREYPSWVEVEFVLHRHNGLSGWSAGTDVVCRFDRHGKKLGAE